jgi:glutamine amidotransferase
VTSDPDAIREAGRVVLPGQSAMPDCIKGLRESGLTEVVVEAATSRPFLGICLGLQMLFESSEEGPTQGLGVLAGRVIRFRDNAMALADGQRLKVPHMGGVRCGRPGRIRCGRAFPTRTRFYFAHSYHPDPADPAATVGTADYPAAFTCAIARANIFATQFHPEKSHRAGLQLLANFVVWNGEA